MSSVAAMLANVVNLQDKKIKTTPLRKVDTVKVAKGQKHYMVVPWRAACDKRINKTAAYLVLTIICGYTNRHGETWVSQQTIADILDVSQQAVSKQLSILVKMGYLEVLQKSGVNRSARHRVVFDPSMTIDDVKANTPARLREDIPEAQPVPKERAREYLKNLKDRLKSKGESEGNDPDLAQPAAQPQELLSGTTPEVVSLHNLEGVMAQPGGGLSTTSGSCAIEVEGSIRKVKWLEE